MKNPIVWYCYDAYCGWCYGFSPIMEKVYNHYKELMGFEVLSGGMVISNKPSHIGVMAGYIAKTYHQVEQTTGIQFGADYLWHIFNPQQSDWYPDSLKPAIALCVFKEYHPDKQIHFAKDLQYALHFEGRDLTDDEAYLHVLDRYEIPHEDFFNSLHSDTYTEKARYEFQWVKQLQVTGYPCVLVQVAESKFYMAARGYTPWDTLQQNLDKILEKAL
jgi:putative protein-disulfide isomerase